MRWAMIVALVLGSITTATAEERIPARPTDLVLPEPRLAIPDWRPLRHELSTGTPVWILPDATLPLVQVTIAVAASESVEPSDHPGLASMTAAMMRRGGAVGRTATEVDLAADRLAAEIVVVAGSERAGATLDVPSWSLDDGLDLFLDLLARPAFEPAIVDAARTTIIASLAHRDDDPEALLDREWRWLVEGRQAPGAGDLTAEASARLTPELLRSFHRIAWRPERMIVAVSGNVETGAIVDRLERAVAAWSRKASGVELELRDGGVEPNTPPEPGLYVVEAEVDRAWVRIGWPVPADRRVRAEEEGGLRLLAEIAGGDGGVSRIAGRLRTAESLVYGVATTLDVEGSSGVALEVTLATDPRLVPRCVVAVREEIARLRAEAPARVEVEAARRSLLTELVLQFDSAESAVGSFALDELLRRGHEHWHQRFDGLGDLSPSDVARAARSRLPTGPPVVLVVAPPGSVPPETVRAVGATSRLRRLPRRDPETLQPISTGSSASGEPDGGAQPADARPSGW